MIIKLIIQWLSPETDNDRLLCPNCGRSEWTIRKNGMIAIQCSGCYRRYENLGVLGLRPI
jgi:hypothetical protein